MLSPQWVYPYTQACDTVVELFVRREYNAKQLARFHRRRRWRDLSSRRKSCFLFRSTGGGHAFRLKAADTPPTRRIPVKNAHTQEAYCSSPPNFPERGAEPLPQRLLKNHSLLQVPFARKLPCLRNYVRCFPRRWSPYLTATLGEVLHPLLFVRRAEARDASLEPVVGLDVALVRFAAVVIVG